MELPENPKSYHKLIVYQKAKELVIATYELTGEFPKEERFVLLPQMRRAAISVAANIVEGYAKNSKKEFSRFLDISIGSISELEVFFEISLNLNYLTKESHNTMSTLIQEVKKLLYSFQKSLKGGIYRK
ncbi:four helix bundle protein [Patescibacteria group bacterium]|nr:four helix bundle protein [Patescibacteria group bacterium]